MTVYSYSRLWHNCVERGFDMNETHPAVVGTFYKIGSIYYYDRSWHGKRYRLSTKQTSLDAAAEWVKTTPFGSRHVRRPIKLNKSFFKRMLGHAKHNARARGIRFNLAIEDIEALYETAGGHCEVSGLPFDMREIDGIQRRPYMPSIDRRDGLLGYSKDNCRMVCSAVNLAMNDFGESVLWDIASSMVMLRSKQQITVKNPSKVSVSEICQNQA